MKTLGLMLTAAVTGLPLVFSGPGQPPAPAVKPVQLEISGIYHGTGVLTNADGQGTDRPYRNVVRPSSDDQ